MSCSLILKLFMCWEQLAVANKCLNETTEVVGDIKRPHSEHGDSPTH